MWNIGPLPAMRKKLVPITPPMFISVTRKEGRVIRFKSEPLGSVCIYVRTLETCIMLSNKGVFRRGELMASYEAAVHV